MNKELFWGMVASGKRSQFEQLSPEDQQWWQSIPDDVKEELKRYGEGNIS